MRKSHSGSVVGFVIWLIVLFLLLVGGIYLVKHNFTPLATGVEKGKEVAKDAGSTVKDAADNTTRKSEEKAKEAAPEAKEAAKEEKPTEKKPEAAPAATTEKDAKGAKKDETKPAATAPKESAPKESAPKEAAKTPDTLPAAPAATPTPENIPTTGALPQTGPVEFLATTAGLTALVSVSIAYLRSHKQRYGSIL